MGVVPLWKIRLFVRQVLYTWQHAAVALLLNAKYRKRQKAGIDEQGKRLVTSLTMGC